MEFSVLFKLGILSIILCFTCAVIAFISIDFNKFKLASIMKDFSIVFAIISLIISVIISL